MKLSDGKTKLGDGKWKVNNGKMKLSAEKLKCVKKREKMCDIFLVFGTKKRKTLQNVS